MVIAIDGPAGSGKSTIAKLLAERLGFTYVNSGNIYRAITLGCLRSGINPTDSVLATEYANGADIAYTNGQVYLFGETVEGLLHSDEIDRYVASLSAIVPIRHRVNDLIHHVSQGLDIVVEGRDITTVVFPQAEHRFYLDASVQSRAKRRYLQGVSKLSLEEIAEGIRQRDEIDKNKAEGSLKVAPGVGYLDTSDLTIEQVYARLIRQLDGENSVTRINYGSDGSGNG